MDRTVNAGDDGGRDPSTGRFVEGNRCGQGNRANRRIAQLRRELQAVADDRLPAVVAAMLERAEQGDVAAARVVLDRMLGQVRQEPLECVEVDLGALGSLEDISAATGNVARLLAAGELDADNAKALLDALAEHRASIEAARLDAIERRLAQLEGATEGATDASS
jgi:hypothetical protein